MPSISKFMETFNEGLFDRETLGVRNVKGGSFFIRWRVSDLIYVGLLFVLYPISYRLEPFQRQFYINDVTISHPFAETERVSNTMLFVYSTWVPLVVIAVVPDFLARCVPRAGVPRDVLVLAKDVCTTDDLPRLMDGFRTTPSGHSSLSFAGLFFLSLWLSGQLAVTRPQAGAFRWAVTFMPTLGAALIALSRTEDYRHHFIDVFVGSCIGLLFATWSYLRLFPSPKEAASYEPRLLNVEEIEANYAPVEEV
ncbi:hypothetical protein OXX79_006652 [Metschnikowia pulcherrima]